MGMMPTTRMIPLRGFGWGAGDWEGLEELKGPGKGLSLGGTGAGGLSGGGGSHCWRRRSGCVGAIGDYLRIRMPWMF